ncbi:MAG: DNA mismatch repair endonuclease MutL [Alphaproteobacteria bacterium]|nr:DNA mismatch repair endonuclease MutL [Alphaproteobacteria bacterium]
MIMIRLLPSHLINQIAAGEVVERPASVVKELVENAIDAGAAKINITAKDGGKSYICVADNGSGMNRENLLKCVERHATSKLPTDDLTNILNLGFRGEAIPSIASVSKMVITTSHEGVGLSIAIEGGNVFEPRPAAIDQGTKIEVSELFYNVPARLSFLQSDRAEISAIIDTVERIAMCYPSIEFIINDTIHFMPTAKKLDRVCDIFGKEFRANLIEVKSDKLSGYISRPGVAKGTSAYQYIFVNGRSVKDKMLLSALRGAYADVMPKGQFAIAALWFDFPRTDIDVNVHPQKLDIRFKEQARVRAMIISIIRAALRESGIGAIAYNKNAEFSPAIMAHANNPIGFVHEFSVDPDSIATEEVANEIAQNFPLGLARGQVFNTYIMAQSDSGLILLDAHAAAERLTYERLREDLESEGVARQMMLIPEPVELGAKNAAAILDIKDELAELGLIIEEFGPGAISVCEVPAIISGCDVVALIKRIADDAADLKSTDVLEERLAMVVKTYACHTSYRAGKSLSVDEMNALLRAVEKSPNAGVCNHGRPAFVQLSKKELDKLFDR